MVKAQWLLGIITSNYPWIGGLAGEWLVGGQLSAETVRNKAEMEPTLVTVVCTVGRYCHAGDMFMTLLKVEKKDKVSRQVRQWRWGCQCWTCSDCRTRRWIPLHRPRSVKILRHVRYKTVKSETTCWRCLHTVVFPNTFLPKWQGGTGQALELFVARFIKFWRVVHDMFHPGRKNC